MSATQRRVMAIAVTYLPDVQALLALVASLSPQVERILIVDNTPRTDDRVFQAIGGLPAFGSSLQLVRLGANLGIATALNIGIEAAISQHFDYVLLSDQDSLPGTGMVASLLSVAEELRVKGPRLGSVNATYMDRTTGQSNRFQVQPRGLFYRTMDGTLATPYAEILTAITSGSLIPCDVFAKVGLMREDYFIDYVDTEWSHRARYHGYVLYGTSIATMEHRLGDATFPVWYLRWRPFNDYSPQRLYYRFRNYVLLMRSGYVPLRWKIRSSWYWFGNFYGYLLFSPGKKQNRRFILRGLVDGLRGRSGPLASDGQGDIHTDHGGADGIR